MGAEEPRRGNTSPFVEGAVTIEVPATSANLGPGFDSLGLALDYFDTLTASIAEGISVVVEGEGEGRLPSGARHLVVRSMMRAFEHIGVDVPGVQLQCVNRIPHSRGMGSSSAAIVGGLALARALLRDSSSIGDDVMLMLANEIEGHPDNVAPAIFGGFTISGQDEDDVWAIRSPINSDLSAVVFIPPTPLSTKTARGLLPDSVPHKDASANAGRAALLVAALATEPAYLLRATEDFLHQNYRASAMPESAQLMQRLRDAGVPAIISGAGPTVLAFTAPGLRDADSLIEDCPAGWRALHLGIGGSGVRDRGFGEYNTPTAG
ncbi:MAG TPA: homoserine kinase [Marmoricola sp.]|nr:homoserine kinase [Marmoricola sp.]